MSHQARFPTERVVRVFTPVIGFKGFTHAGDFLGEYLPGRRYFLREGNAELDKSSRQWAADGRIRWEIE